ncbi:MAG: alkaline phytoceramidase [Alphaproteobacteria bacterium]
MTIVLWTFPAIPQDLSYHMFADRRTLHGIPHFWNVVSNIPIFLVGVYTLVSRFSSGKEVLAGESYLWRLWTVLAIAVAVGSTYYHTEPENQTLIWDRLPIAMLAVVLLAYFIMDRVNNEVGLKALPLLLLLGGASVIYWGYTELMGAGDLRPYILVQYGSIVMVLALMVAFGSRYTHSWLLVVGLGWYGVAKVFEILDHEIYRYLEFQISGHTLKHFSVAAALACIALYMKHKKVIQMKKVKKL